MEVNAVERLLTRLQEIGLKIRVFATDRSVTVRKLMAKMFPHIKHQFDVWYCKMIFTDISSVIKFLGTL